MDQYNPIVLGSEWFLLPEPSREELQAQAQAMIANGQKIARIFLYWNEFLQKYENLWSFDFFDTVFEVAAEAGLLLTVTLNPATIPRWLRNQGSQPERNSFANPDIWPQGLEYVRRVVKRYHQSPALHSWILENEPTLRDRPNVHMILGFREYLRQRYGTIEAFNHSDIRSFYMSFDEIGLIREDGSAELNTALDHGKGYVFQVEWFDYCSKLLEDRLADISRTIRSIDRIHPTTVNPTAMVWGHPGMGQNIFRLGGLVDFLGNSSHPAWSSQIANTQRHDFVAIKADATRSATRDPDGRFWVTELQAGNTFFSGSERNCSTPTADELNHWLWEIIGAGASGIIYWLWRTRKRGWEGLEWGLTDLYGQASERSQQSAQVAALLAKYSDLFAAVRAPRPDAWLLYSYASLNLGYVEGSAASNSLRSCDLHSQALFGAYTLLRDLGYSALFADEANNGQIAGLPTDALLVAPSAYALETHTIQALASFVRSGGTLVTDGLFALKDRYGRQQLEAQPLVEDLLGASLSDIITTQEEINMLMNGLTVPGWFVQNRFRDINSAQIAGVFTDGQPAVLVNRYGRGRVIHIGTRIFERYAGQQEASCREFLQQLLPVRQSTGIRLCNPGPDLHLKRLTGDRQEVVILLNHQQKGCTAEIYCPCDAVWTDLLSGETGQLSAGSFANAVLSTMQVRIWRVDWLRKSD